MSLRTFRGLLRVILIATVFVIGGCGGGGGGASAPADPPAPPPNEVPTSSAGPDQTLRAGSLVTLAGTGQDSDGTISTYLWAQTSGTPAVTIGDPDMAQATFTAPAVNADTMLVFQLTVTDNSGATAMDSVTITVNPNLTPTAAPIAESVIPNTPLEIEIFEVPGNTEGDAPGSISVTNPANGTATVFKTRVTYTPNPTYSGADSFNYTITDADNETASATVSLTVAQPGSGAFTVSGTVSPPAAVAVDTDTNDPNAVYKSNDTLGEAPTISNPVTFGGFVNVANSGNPGRSQTIGDLDDYFRVELLAGQEITMLVADYDTGDTDLYLYDSNGVIVDFSIEIGQIERLTVAANGVYYVNAYAYSGASNYVITIGTPVANNAFGGLKLSSDFVVGQAIVKYDTNLANGMGGTAGSVAAAAGFRIRAGAPNRQMLLELQPGAAALVSADADSSQTKAHSFRNAEDRAKWETLMAIKSLNNDPTVEYAEPNYISKAFAVPTDPMYIQQAHYPFINLPAAWDQETGKPNVIVAVIDTGVLLSHPDLQGQLVAGYDFISNPATARDGDGIDANPDDPGDSSGGQPSSFHGTHVSGTVAAKTNNTIGGAGVAWGAKIMPLRVLGLGGGTDYDINQAVLFAAGLPNDSGTVPAQRADIMNLSLGGAGASQASQATYTAARNAGVLIVAAAGNENTATLSYPASYDGVISVSSVNLRRIRASYSNFGTAVDIAAPGGEGGDTNGDGFPDFVLSTAGDDSGPQISFTYTFQQGTSMASPHVAGVMALMKSANANITPDIVDQLLIAGKLTDDIGTVGRDNDFGHGLVNAQKAVAEALALVGGPPPADDPILTITPRSLNFDNVTTEIEITARNSKTGTLRIVSISGDQPWLTVAPSVIDNEGLGTYRVTVNRTGLTAGLYSAVIAAESTASGNAVKVPVVMSVTDTVAGGDIGFIYILLVDATNDTTIAQVTPPLSNGTYSYSFPNVPVGVYEIFAGTDADNDRFICDPGEACGVFLTTEQPVQIQIKADRANLNFPVGFNVALPTTNAVNDEPDQPARGVSRNPKTSPKTNTE